MADQIYLKRELVNSTAQKKKKMKNTKEGKRTDHTVRNFNTCLIGD